LPEGRRDRDVMPMSIKGFLLFFGPLLGMVALIALAAFLREVFGSRLEAVQAAARRRALTPAEARWVGEFHVRRRRFHIWTWSAAAAACGALALGGRLSAAALLLLVPLSAAVVHLRCPSCDSTPGLRGMLERRRCRRCGVYLGG